MVREFLKKILVRESESDRFSAFFSKPSHAQDRQRVIRDLSIESEKKQRDMVQEWKASTSKSNP